MKNTKNREKDILASVDKVLYRAKIAHVGHNASRQERSGVMARKVYQTRFPVRKLNRKIDYKRQVLSKLPRAGARKGKGISRRGR